MTAHHGQPTASRHFTARRQNFASLMASARHIDEFEDAPFLNCSSFSLRE
jgi:hypothetical protein